jgi:flagellum-specific peptidoglycan hydrolase FlgJ
MNMATQITTQAVKAAAEAYSKRAGGTALGHVNTFRFMLDHITASQKASTTPEPKPAAKPMTRQEAFVAKYMPYARKTEAATGISAIFIVAQAALESGWGKSSIGNNVFGITASSNWKGKKQLLTTMEYHDTQTVKYPEVISITWDPERKKYKYVVKRYFRDYDSIEEAFLDHARVLSLPHFAHAQPYKADPLAFAQALQAGPKKYATSPRYAEVLGRVVEIIESI